MSMDEDIEIALSANKAYVVQIRALVASLDQEEIRLKRRISLLKRRTYHAKMKQKAEAVKCCLNLWDNTSAPLKRQRVAGPFFRSAYVKESQTGTLEHGFVEPDANQDTQNATKLRPLLAPLCQTTAFPWTTQDERQIKKIFDAWIHHDREPTLEEWEAMVIPGRSIEEMKLRWLRQVLLASKWTSAEIKQLKLLGDKRSHDWIAIAHDMSSSKKMRYPMECFVHYQRECNPFITNGDLSKRKRQATKTYAPFVQNYGEDWECKAELFQHRSPEDLEHKRASVQAAGQPLALIDRLLVLAAFCYSNRWSDIRWASALAHFGPHRLHRSYTVYFQTHLQP
ncbi:hypothetical protein AC1031_007105 [Aphanomyces cochlioides]|nr:hypothetical protein AC1031_007105 [Aphanomyces cochlioides]